jgi:GTP cyclohydrolase II
MANYKGMMEDYPNNFAQAIAMRRIDRAVHELRGGYPVLLAGENNRAWFAISAETIEDVNHAKMVETNDSETALVITGIRAQRLGFDTSAMASAYALPFSLVEHNATLLAQCIDPVQGKADITDLHTKLRAANEAELSALELAKLGALLPAMIITEMHMDDAAAWAVEKHILTVKLADIMAYKDGLSASLSQVSSAHVPLKLAEDARVLAFRPRYGNVEHLAICIGQPEQQHAPLVRLHSSCVTGDILGSLRCDCGEQLQEAIARLAAEGHGMVLYMSQEGRGIGIANKLRAYCLQDAGLDTVDANEEIGFAPDEREFNTAAQMLTLLGIRQVRLLSNNPDKVAQLEQCGIIVTNRESLILPANIHNKRYLDTKEKRCGHIF